MSEFTKTYTWEQWATWEANAEAERVIAMQGDFARGQREPEPHEHAGKRVHVYIGTFARGMRQHAPEERWSST